jgi:hypothetical protein
MGRESIIQDGIKAAGEFSCSTTYKEYLVKTPVLCCVGPGLRPVRNASDSVFKPTMSCRHGPWEKPPGMQAAHST